MFVGEVPEEAMPRGESLAAEVAGERIFPAVDSLDVAHDAACARERLAALWAGMTRQMTHRSPRSFRDAGPAMKKLYADLQEIIE